MKVKILNARRIQGLIQIYYRTSVFHLISFWLSIFSKINITSILIGSLNRTLTFYKISVNSNCVYLFLWSAFFSLLISFVSSFKLISLHNMLSKHFHLTRWTNDQPSYPCFNSILIHLSISPLQDVHVVLLSPAELESKLRILLQVPLWVQRVTYLKGSALNDQDLIRARWVNKAPFISWLFVNTQVKRFACS